MEALKFLKENEYEGEIIARMTVSYKTDIYEDVTHLLKFFPYVHWQLDVVWSNLWNWEKFRKWANESYKPGIKKLIEIWIKEIEKGRLVITGLKKKKGRWVIYVKRPSQMSTEVQNNNAD